MQDIFSKDNVTIWSDVPKRDFIFTEDAADAVLKLLNVDFTGTLNLGTGKMSSIKDITKIIENLSGKRIISENKDVSGPLEFSTEPISESSVDPNLTFKASTYSPFGISLSSRLLFIRPRIKFL
jgi:nucleoside-diphosphate-sugar epimerase